MERFALKEDLDGEDLLNRRVDATGQFGQDRLQLVVQLRRVSYGASPGLHGTEHGPEASEAFLVILQCKVMSLLKGPKVGREELFRQKIPKNIIKDRF